MARERRSDAARDGGVQGGNVERARIRRLGRHHGTELERAALDRRNGEVRGGSPADSAGRAASAVARRVRAGKGGSAGKGGTAGRQARRGRDCATWPAASSSAERRGLDDRQVSGTFDGMLQRFVGSGPLGTRRPAEGQAPLFELANGATLKNVIIGSPAGRRRALHGHLHARERVVGGRGRGRRHLPRLVELADHDRATAAAPRSATDKVFQHNGARHADDQELQRRHFGKLYRSCGNCSSQYARHVVLRDVTGAPGKTLVGINTNYGDTADFERITVYGQMTICERYTGNSNGGEPVRTGAGRRLAILPLRDERHHPALRHRARGRGRLEAGSGSILDTISGENRSRSGHLGDLSNSRDERRGLRPSTEYDGEGGDEAGGSVFFDDGAWCPPGLVGVDPLARSWVGDRPQRGETKSGNAGHGTLTTLERRGSLRKPWSSTILSVCLPEPLPHDAEGGLICSLFSARLLAGGGSCTCGDSARRIPVELAAHTRCARSA